MPLSDLLAVVPSGEAWLPVIDAIAKATVILVVAALASFALRRASAAARHLVWTLALTSAVVLPVLSLALPRWQVGLVTVERAGPAVTPGTTDSIVGSAPDAAPPDLSVGPPTDSVAKAQSQQATNRATLSLAVPRLSWPAALALLWALGAALVLGRLVVGLVAVQWMSRRTANVSDAPWLSLARRLADELRVSRRIVFLRSERAAMPMAWGVFLPSVLMPADADAWPAERLRIVLLHELAHVKRRDCLTHAVAQVACALYWFNPLAWVAARHVRAERERACDDLVLASGTRGPDYADQLLEIARVMRAGRFPAVLAGATLAMAHRSHLEGRLMAILDPTVRRSGISRLRTAAATAIFAGALLPLASMQPWTYVAEAAPADGLAAQTPAPRPEPSPNPSASAEVARGVREGVRGGVVGGVSGGVAGGVLGGVAGGISETIVGPTVEAVLESMAGVFAQEKVKTKEVDKGKGQTRREVDPRTVAALTAALKDTDKEVRETALLALVRLRDPNVFDPLVQALGDPSPDMREQAAFGLGQLKDPRAVAPLTNAL
jgi:beta-lactamase regulating signal transducer with metallopeptidase domain